MFAFVVGSGALSKTSFGPVTLTVPLLLTYSVLNEAAPKLIGNGEAIAPDVSSLRPRFEPAMVRYANVAG